MAKFRCSTCDFFGDISLQFEENGLIFCGKCYNIWKTPNKKNICTLDKDLAIKQTMSDHVKKKKHRK